MDDAPESLIYAPDLTRLRRMFDDAREGMQSARLESQTDRDYFDNKQWSKEDLATLRKRNQPPIVTNRLRAGIEGVLGIVEQGATKPRAYARNPAGEDSADVASQALRFIADTSHFGQTKLDCMEDYLVEGCCAVEVEVDGEDVTPRQIRWEEFFYDPRSRRHDYKDARYLGIAKWMYLDDVTALYPHSSDVLNNYLTNGVQPGALGQETWEDRPDCLTPWVSSKTRRVMVVQIYFQDQGNWMRAVFWAAGVLEAAASPYKDEKGRPACAIEAQSFGVNRENHRYGLARLMRSQQDEINMRRSRALHLLNARPIVLKDMSMGPADADEARREAARPDGILPPGYDYAQPGNMAQGNLELLQDAKAEIERFAPNPAILGRQGADSSGRAVLARQSAGMVELARTLGRFEDFELRCYRQMWARAKQFWQAPKWIRVTDDIGAPTYIQVNDPRPVLGKGPDGQPVMGDPQMSPLMQHPETGEFIPPQPVPTTHHLAQMDVDIVVDTVPDTATIAQEQFNELLRLMGTNPMWAQSLTIQDVLAISSIPNKKEIIDKITQRQEAAQQQQAQQAQQAQAIGAAQLQSKLAKEGSETARNAASATKQQVEAVALAAQTHIGLDNHLYPPPGDPTGETVSAGP